jgi:pSer/pThr/pTyr-binding forkhead associated (FHA) protein
MQIKLVIVHGKPEGKCLSFPAGAYMFGRGSECHIRPNSDWVSRQHCELVVSHETARLRDLGSRNGTLLNGERLQGERDLAHGDRLQVGPLVFEVSLQETEAGPDTIVKRPTLPAIEETGSIAALHTEAFRAVPEPISEGAITKPMVPTAR